MTTTRKRFNEAPANSPGNGRKELGGDSLRHTRFNEAPANSPGNAAKLGGVAPKGGLLQ